jgi:hypothetical protein
MTSVQPVSVTPSIPAASSGNQVLPNTSPGAPSSLVSPPGGSLIPNINELSGNPCNDLTCNPACCTPCGPPGRFWVEADYLLWWTSGSHLPALITSAPPNTTNFGELGRPDTRVVYGNNTINNNGLSGFQIRAGFWFDDCHTCGLDVSFFDLPTTGTNYLASSNGANVALFRPFFNAATGAQGSEDVAFLRDGITGSVGVRSSSSYLGGDANLRCQLCCVNNCCDTFRLDLLTGYRVLNLQESLEIDENLKTTSPAGSILVQDRFTANNLFNGFQIGLDGEWMRNGWILGLRSLVALGVTTQTVNISGETVLTPAGGTTTTLPGGLLAQSTNIGRYTRDPFTVVPSVGLRLGRQITDNLRLTVGYDFLYWSNVAHAANQIDPVLNPYYIPTTGTPIGSPIPARPAFMFHSSDYVVHGLTFAAQLRF